MRATMAETDANVINSILHCLRLIEQKQELLAKDGKCKESSPESVKEVLFDVHIALCKLASVLVTAPITGRMFLPLPQSYVSHEEQQESLRAQLGLH